jgi:hypothetical protein
VPLVCLCVCLHRSVWDDYEADTELIGRGAFARVFRAIRREDSTPVAIKVIGRETKAFAQQRRGEGGGGCVSHTPLVYWLDCLTLAPLPFCHSQHNISLCLQCAAGTRYIHLRGGAGRTPTHSSVTLLPLPVVYIISPTRPRGTGQTPLSSCQPHQEPR